MRVVWTRRVSAELDEIWSFFADRSVPYADRLRARIVQRGDSLGRFPGQGRKLPNSTERELSIPDTQYLIVYDIEEETVRILRLWHTAQDRKR